MLATMHKVWNTMNAPPAVRAGLGTPRAASEAFDFRGSAARERVRHDAHDRASKVERLVLVSTAAEGNPMLEQRATLIAGGMRPSPGLVTLGATDDVPALTQPSDLVLVDRRKPARFIAPYLGRPARRLLRETTAPVLVVAGKSHAPYKRVVIATDLGTDLSAALAAVRKIAPDASLTLLHVYHALFDGKLQWAGVQEIDIAQYRVDAQREAALGMAALVDRHPAIEHSRTLLRYGWPVPGILRTAREVDADLIVVVRKSRSWWADVLGASVSHDVAQRAERDVLIVRAPVYSPGDPHR